MYLEAWMVPFVMLIVLALAASGVSLFVFKNKKLAFILSLISASQIVVLLVLGLVYGKRVPQDKESMCIGSDCTRNDLKGE